jgi:threonine dehydratase
VCDGLLTSLSARTFAILLAEGVAIVTADEAAIVAAMRHLWERLKVVVEPSAAVPLATILTGAAPVRGRRVGVILSGGNVDLERLPFGAGAPGPDAGPGGGGLSRSA